MFWQHRNQNKKLKSNHFYIEKQQVVLAFLLDAKKTKDHLSSFLNTETIAKTKNIPCPQFYHCPSPNVWFSQLVEQAQGLAGPAHHKKIYFV